MKHYTTEFRIPPAAVVLIAALIALAVITDTGEKPKEEPAAPAAELEQP